MKAKVYDSGSIKTVLVQDDNGDKFITGLGELLDMMDGEDNWEIETTSGNTLTGKLYKYNKLMREVGEIRREIESYNNSKVFPVNDMFSDIAMEHAKEIVDKYNELQLRRIDPDTPIPLPNSIKSPTCTTRGEGEDFIGVYTGHEINPASEKRNVNLSVNWITLYGMRGNVNRSEEGEYRLVFEDEEYHMVMLPTLHGNFVPLARIEHEGMMVMVVNVYSPDGEIWNAKVDDTPFIKEGLPTPGEALTGLFEYIKNNKIALEDLNKLGIYSNTKTIGSYTKYTVINVQVAVRFEDIAVQGGEEEPTLDVLFVFFNVKDIEGKPVPHFMVPSLTTNNDYIMEEGCDDPASLVKKALGDYKLSAGDMEYLGWEGDTPPRITKEDVKDMVHVDDCVLVTRKVPRKLIARE